jgi:hypothetical protein
VAQQRPHALAHRVVAVQRGRCVQGQESKELRWRRHFPQRSGKDGHERAQVQQRMGIDRQHVLVISAAALRRAQKVRIVMPGVQIDSVSSTTPSSPWPSPGVA